MHGGSGCGTSISQSRPRSYTYYRGPGLMGALVHYGTKSLAQKSKSLRRRRVTAFGARFLCFSCRSPCHARHHETISKSRWSSTTRSTAQGRVEKGQHWVWYKGVHSRFFLSLFHDHAVYNTSSLLKASFARMRSKGGPARDGGAERKRCVRRLAVGTSEDLGRGGLV